MFGADGHDRIVKTLKQQIADRDGRLSVLTQDKRQREDKLNDALKALDTQRQRAENEEARADRAEAAHKEATNELAQAKLDVGNLEAQLRAQTEIRTGLEKEVKRLEYELHSSASTSGPGPSTQEAKLAARVKSLEQDLARKEGELRQAQTNAKLSSNGPTPRKARGRGRSSSVGGELSDLTSQRDVAAEAATSAQKELEVLREKLRNADRQRDKAVNEHMALQKRSAKDIEALQDRVDELQYEIDALSGGNPQRKDTDKLKTDLETALGRVEALERSIADKDAEIARLSEAEKAAVNSGDDEAVADLRGQIAELEGELDAAKSAAPRSAGQFQRELKAALRRIEAKEREITDLKLDLQEANDENESLRENSGAIPNGHVTSDGGAERVAELEKQLEEEREAAAAKLQELQHALDARSTDLEEARRDLETERSALATLREEMEALSAKSAATSELETAVGAAQERIAELEAGAATHAAKLAEMEQTLETSHQQLLSAQKERDDVKAALDEKETALAEIKSKAADLERQLQQSSGDADAVDAIRKQLAEKEGAVTELEKSVASLNTELKNASDETQRQREMANTFQSDLMELEQQLHGEIDQLQGVVDGLRKKLDEAEAQIRDKDSKLQVAVEDLSRSTSDNSRALDRIKSLEKGVQDEPVSNTGKDKQLAELQEKIDHLHAQLQEKELLLDGTPDVPSPSAEKAQIDAMTVTIMRLRSQRDEYKGQLRFVEQELGFASNAAKKKESAAEELKAAISQLEEKTAAHTALAEEKAALQRRVDDLQNEAASNAAVVAERDALQNRLTEIEAERDNATTQVHELEAKIATLQSELDALSQKLSEDKNAHETQLAAEKELRREAEERAERTAALSASVDDDETKRQLAELFARVERRDSELTAGAELTPEHIKNLEADKNKLHLNLTVAQEDAQEATEELQSLKAKHAELMESASKTDAELDAARGELEHAQTRAEALEEDITKLEGVQAEHESLKTSHDALRAEHEELVATHAKATTGIHELDGKHASLVFELETARAQIDGQQQRVAALESELEAAVELAASTEVESLVLALAVHRQAVVKAEGNAGRVSADLATALTKIAILEQEHGALLQQSSEVSTLRAELETSREALATAEAKATTLEQVQAELSSAGSEKAELQERLADIEAKLAETTTTRNGLEERVAALDKDLDAAQFALETAKTEHQAAIERMEQQLEEINTEAEQQISATNDRLAKAAASHEEAMVEAENDLAAARSKAAADLEAANDRLATAENEVETLSERVNTLTSDRVKARSELNSERVRVEEAEVTIAGLRADVKRLEDELAATSEFASSARTRIDELVGELSLAKAEQSALASELDGAQDDLDALRARESDLATKLDEATTALEAEQQANKAAQARAAAAEAETKKASSHFNFMERQQVDLSTRLAALRDELAEAQAKAKDLPAKEEELARLVKANDDLKAELRDLEEDIQGKIAMLDAKNMDIEEADDREMELKKQIKKIGARADKLSRKNKALEKEVETLQNTMENMSPAKPARVAALRSSPSIEVARSRTSTGAASSDVPPSKHEESTKPFNVFAAADRAPAGTPRAKRGREEDDVDAARAAEAWVLAPTKVSPGKSPISRKPLGALVSKTDNERQMAARPKRTKPMSSTERVFMEKRAQLASTTPSERKFLSGGGVTPGDRRYLSGGVTPGTGHKVLSGGVRNVFATTPAATTATPRERPNVFAMGTTPSTQPH